MDLPGIAASAMWHGVTVVGSMALAQAPWFTTCRSSRSEDVLTVRMPSRDEQQRLDLPPGTPVQVIHGGTYDQGSRPLHYTYVVGAGGRIEFAYRYGTVPEG
jgi:DNA-binding GntR family transcriptional regulator